MNFLPFFKVFFCLSFILQIKLLTRTKFIHICILLFIATSRHTKKLPWTRQFFLTLWSWSPSCADRHNQHAAHYRDIASSSSYLRLGQAQISDLLCGWWPAFLSETSWSYRTDHHFLLMGRPVKENSISYLKAFLIQHGWILCDRGKIEGVFIYISMRLKRIRPHERKLRIRLSGKGSSATDLISFLLQPGRQSTVAAAQIQYGTASRSIDQFCHVIAMLMHEGKIYGASFCFPLHGYAPFNIRDLRESGPPQQHCR